MSRGISLRGLPEPEPEKARTTAPQQPTQQPTHAGVDLGTHDYSVSFMVRPSPQVLQPAQPSELVVQAVLEPRSGGHSMTPWGRLRWFVSVDPRNFGAAIRFSNDGGGTGSAINVRVFGETGWSYTRDISTGQSEELRISRRMSRERVRIVMSRAENTSRDNVVMDSAAQHNAIIESGSMIVHASLLPETSVEYAYVDVTCTSRVTSPTKRALVTAGWEDSTYPVADATLAPGEAARLRLGRQPNDLRRSRVAIMVAELP